MDGQRRSYFIVADKTQIVYDALGQLRLNHQKIITNNNEYKFLWITEFPFIEFDNEEKRYTAMHHPLLLN